MWRPNGLRLSQYTSDIACDFLGYYDDEPRSDLIWKVMMAMFDYPFPGLMKDVTFISVNIRSDCEMPFRAIAKKPIYHPTFKNHRLCPNFPLLSVDKTGNVRPSLATGIEMNGINAAEYTRLTFGQLGDYYLTQIPGRQKSQYVSHVQIYGDAWGHTPCQWEAYTYAPKNGDSTDLRPENIIGKPRSRNMKISYREFPLSEGVSFPYPEKAYVALSKQVTSDAEALVNEFECYYAGRNPISGEHVIKTDWNSIHYDWYYNRYWAICLWGDPKRDPIVATSFRELHSRTGIPPNVARTMLKNPKKYSNQLLFLL